MRSKSFAIGLLTLAAGCTLAELGSLGQTAKGAQVGTAVPQPTQRQWSPSQVPPPMGAPMPGTRPQPLPYPGISAGARPPHGAPQPLPHGHVTPAASLPRLRIRPAQGTPQDRATTQVPQPSPIRPVSVERVVDERKWDTKKVPNPTGMRKVNSKRVLLNYEVKDVGPSGISAIELWYTRDGENWQKDLKPIRKGPPYVFQAETEGTYGFTLIARSGLGRGKRPPQKGDVPQVWVQVDVSKPVVKLLDIKQGLGARANEITIEWQAQDGNLGARPITIAYAASPQGPWKVVAANVPNTGSHLWMIPSDLPPRFWMRVQAQDEVGNLAHDQTRNGISVDTSEPTVSILEVESADPK